MNIFFRSLMISFTGILMLCLTMGCCGQKNKKKSVIILKKPGSASLKKVMKKVYAVSESRISENKVKLSDEAISKLYEIDLEKLKKEDYDKYIEYKYKIKASGLMTGKMVEKFQKNIKSMLGVIKSVLRNDEKKSFAKYSKRLSDEIIRFFGRKKMDANKARETYIFIRVSLFKTFVDEKGKKWSKDFLTEINALIQQDKFISPERKRIVKFQDSLMHGGLNQ